MNKSLQYLDILSANFAVWRSIIIHFANCLKAADVGDDGIQALAVALCMNSSLYELKIRCMCLT